MPDKPGVKIMSCQIFSGGAEGLDRSQRRYDPQLQHYDPQIRKQQRLAVTE